MGCDTKPIDCERWTFCINPVNQFRLTRVVELESGAHPFDRTPNALHLSGLRNLRRCYMADTISQTEELNFQFRISE